MLIKMEIDRNSIEENLEKIRKINKNIICVLKDDAYGIGIENVLPILLEKGCRYFAVAYIEEALKIQEIVRKKGISGKKVSKESFFGKNVLRTDISEDLLREEEEICVMMLGCIENEDLERALEKGIEITIFSLEQLIGIYKILLDKKISEKIERKRKEYDNVRVNISKALKIHIKINTGMNRLGFNLEEIEPLLKELEKFEKEGINIEIKSVYTHIFDSEDEEMTAVQVEKYESILSELEKRGPNYMKGIFRHIQASPLLFKYKEKYNYDFARVGMAIYGMEPLSKKVGLSGTIRIISKIIAIRNVKKGERVSYGKKGILEKDKRIGIIPIGYAHGLKKQLEDKGAYILIKGEKAPIFGEVCMDMVIVDITSIGDVKIDDEAVIIGKQGNKEITLLDMADWAGTIQDDILTSWGKSIKRTVK